MYIAGKVLDKVCSYTFSPCIQKTDDTPAALATACPDL